jgi:hypothetical protein
LRVEVETEKIKKQQLVKREVEAKVEDQKRIEEKLKNKNQDDAQAKEKTRRIRINRTDQYQWVQYGATRFFTNGRSPHYKNIH